MVKSENLSVDDFASFLDGFEGADRGAPVDLDAIDVKPFEDLTPLMDVDTKAAVDVKPPVDVKPAIHAIDTKPPTSATQPMDAKPAWDARSQAIRPGPLPADSRRRDIGFSLGDSSANNLLMTTAYWETIAIMNRRAQAARDAAYPNRRNPVAQVVKMETDPPAGTRVVPPGNVLRVPQPPAEAPASVLMRYPGRLACAAADHPVGPFVRGVYYLRPDGSNLPTGRNGWPWKLVLQKPKAVLQDDRRISLALYYMNLVGLVPNQIAEGPIEHLEEHLDLMTTAVGDRAVGCPWLPKPRILRPEDIKPEVLEDYEEDEPPAFAQPEDPSTTSGEEEAEEEDDDAEGEDAPEPDAPLQLPGPQRRRALWRQRGPRPPRRHPRQHPLAQKLGEREAEIRRLRKRLDDREDTLHRVRREREELRHRVTRLYTAMGEPPRALTPFREVYGGRNDRAAERRVDRREERREDRRRGKVTFSPNIVIISGLQGGDVWSPGVRVEDPDY